MVDRLKGMADWKTIGLKVLVYVLLIISFVMFGKGWLTFESSRTRRNISSSAKGLLEDMDDISDYEWEEVNDRIASYDLDISAEDFVKRVRQVGEALEDAEISPKETVNLMSSISWLGDKAGDLSGLGRDQETKKALSQAKTYSILLRILYIITILCFWGSFLALATSAGIGTYAYSIMILFEFIIFVIFKARMDKFMERILGSLGGVSSDNMAMKLCAPAFASLIFAILASVAWAVLQNLCKQEGKAVPNLLSIYKKGTKASVPILPKGTILPKGPVCVCGAKLDKNAKFCAVCGRKVSEMVPAKSVCQSCGAELEPGSVFCSVCGQKVAGPAPVKPEPKPAAVCPNCGKPVEPGSLFCSVCGTRLEEIEERTFISEPASAGLKNGPKVLTLTSAEDASKQLSRQIREGESLSVGRQKESDIVIDFNGSVSRKHCSIFMENGEIYVKDEGSSFNTYVNEQIANYPVTVRDGDTITLGNCKLNVDIQ